jgi:hypothetical protein
MKICNTLLPIMVSVLIASAQTGCVTDVDGSSASEPKPTSTDQLQSGNAACTLASAATGFAAGAAVTLATSTGTCAVGMAVTGYGEAFCAVPAAGTALASVTAILAGGVAWATCNAWIGPVVQSETRAEGCVEGQGKFCRNLNWRYKQACGQDQFSELGNCFGMDSCIEITNMLWRASACKRGRQLMGEKCYDSIDDGHQQAIDHANNIQYDCKARYQQLDCWGSQGLSPDVLSRTAADNIVEQAYLCR